MRKTIPSTKIAAKVKQAMKMKKPGIGHNRKGTKGSPGPIDAHVGKRLRIRRSLFGLSQEKLGEKIGITFQQIQKYEKGDNRIAAERLYLIAKVLGVPVGYFYEGITQEMLDEMGFGFLKADPYKQQISEGNIDDLLQEKEISNHIRKYLLLKEADPANSKIISQMMDALLRQYTKEDRSKE